MRVRGTSAVEPPTFLMQRLPVMRRAGLPSVTEHRSRTVAVPRVTRVSVALPEGPRATVRFNGQVARVAFVATRLAVSNSDATLAAGPCPAGAGQQVALNLGSVLAEPHPERVQPHDARPGFHPAGVPCVESGRQREPMQAVDSVGLKAHSVGGSTGVSW